MEILFANRQRLPSAYKTLFIEHLTNLDKLKDAIQSRFSKKEIKDQDFKKLFTFNQRALFELIGPSNDNRFRHFFGSHDHFDRRDTQISCLDRFILDSVHFEVCRCLIKQFEQEYQGNKESIEKEWQSIMPIPGNEKSIPLQYYIQKEIIATKDIVLSELIFPKNQRVRLFSLEHSTLKLNEHVFSNWLPQKNESNLVRNLMIGGAILLLLALIPLPFLLIGGSAGIAIASTSLVVKTVLTGVIAAGLVSIASALSIQFIRNKLKAKEPSEPSNVRYNHHSLYTDLYHSTENKHYNKHEVSPFHNNRWMLSQPRSIGYNTFSNAKTEEVSCVLK
ncbi:hypothetical protein [Legionella waltersii]|uniref:Uncharacterized protein n=1 Tax=Legionella waltersii TaxID=66969 RepID=A0A0W1A1A5_9GAMM|nr:hypothetical protein [Legionella waltersii]KTD75114.1 hypothetical protein Lwal_3155 [Legionella waltersii]SNV05016.1 Uncharacterised protein [Legionella waltersii]